MNMRPSFSLFALTFAVASMLSVSAVAQVMTLEQARQRAADAAFDVRDAQLRVAQAETMRRQVRAIWIPSVDLAAVYTLHDEGQELVIPNVYEPIAPWLDTVAAANPALPPSSVLTDRGDEVMVVREQHAPRGILTVTQNLYAPAAAPLRDQAAAQREVAEGALDVTRLGVDGAVVELYFGAARWLRIVEAAEGNVELADLAVQRAERALQYEVGTAFELNRAQVDASRARREADSARTAYRHTIEALAMVLDVPPDFDVEAPAPSDVPLDVDALVAEALDARPEVRLAQAQLALHEARFRETRRGWVPAVQAQFEAMAQRETAFGGDAFVWNAQVAAAWSLYDGGQRSAEADARALDAESARLAADEARVRIRTDVTSAVLRAADREREVAQAREEAALAERNDELTRQAADAGVASTLDVRAAREQLYLAQIAVGTAEVEYAQALVELERVMGR